MRLKHIKDADLIIECSPYFLINPEYYKGKWKEVFNNDNPVHIEIGTGRGKFIIEKAINNPNINFIGIEKYDSPLVKATKKLENININNLKLICFDALNIDDLFVNEIDKIYLNFSDPWPKKRHAKRRLTSPVFMDKYELIFKNKKSIELKTDNIQLYEYSIETFTLYGYEIVKSDTNYIDTITTEYEDKFIKNGIKINYIKVEK